MFWSRSLPLIAFLMSFSAFAKHHVVVEKVTMDETYEAHSYVGTLRAKFQANVASEEEGKVDVIYFREGDRVKEGDVIFRLDTALLELKAIELEQDYQAMLAQKNVAENNLAFETEELKNLEYTRKNNVLSEQEVRNIERNFEVAKNRHHDALYRVKVKKAKLDYLKERIENVHVKAPFDGIVTQRFVEKGEWINKGQVAFKIVNDAQLQAWFEVSEEVANNFNSHHPLKLLIDGESFEVPHSRLVREIDPAHLTSSVIAEMQNPTLKYIAGQTVKAWIPSGEIGNFKLVSKDAVVRRNGQELIYKVVKDGDEFRAERQTINILFEQSGHVAIESELIQEGDMVIVDGNERLIPGPVTIVNSDIAG
ncbi:MAG: efflux RND transporter periplasmic adaptor subunit [Aestuariibacter sp.]